MKFPKDKQPGVLLALEKNRVVREEAPGYPPVGALATAGTRQGGASTRRGQWALCRCCARWINTAPRGRTHHATHPGKSARRSPFGPFRFLRRRPWTPLAPTPRTRRSWLFFQNHPRGWRCSSDSARWSACGASAARWSNPSWSVSKRFYAGCNCIRRLPFRVVFNRVLLGAKHCRAAEVERSKSKNSTRCVPNDGAIQISKI